MKVVRTVAIGTAVIALAGVVAAAWPIAAALLDRR